MMTAYYSYGNSEIVIDKDPEWNTFNICDSDLIISKVNKAIKTELNIEVSDMCGSFPSKLWFEMGH